MAAHLHVRSDKEMHWSDVQVVPPRAEPLHIEEARKHLRLTEDDSRDEDDLIAAWIADSRGAAEDLQGRQYVLATWDLVLDRFPASGEIALPHPPLREVVSIAYTDDGGQQHPVNLSGVIVDTSSEPGRVVLRRGKSWPSAALQAAGGVVVRYKAGYSTPFTVDASTSIITAHDHPHKDGDRVRLWNTGGALPHPLKEQKDYFVVDVNGDAFKLSESASGPPVALSSIGSGTHFLGLIPEGVRAALKLMVGSRFDHREDMVVGTITSEMPQSAKSLLWPRQVRYLGPAGVR